VKENDIEVLSNSMFLNVITSSFFSDFLKLFREELLGFSNLGQHGRQLMMVMRHNQLSHSIKWPMSLYHADSNVSHSMLTAMCHTVC